MKAAIVLAVLAALTSRATADDNERPRTGVVDHDIVRGGLEGDALIKAVEIDNRLGDVEIEGHDSNEIVIIAIKRAPDQETLDRLRVALLANPNGKISIGTALKAAPSESRPIPAGSIRIDLIVRAPRSATVGAKLWNGSVDVHSVDNGADLSVNEGSIDVRHVSGEIETSSAVGAQRFLEVIDATIRAQAVDGDMTLDTVSGDKLEATVHDGEIVGRNIRVAAATLRSTTGDISYQGELTAGGEYRLASIDGDVELKVEIRGKIQITASARKGTVTLPSTFETKEDIESGFVTGTFGAGKDATQISLRSNHGSVTLVDWDF